MPNKSLRNISVKLGIIVIRFFIFFLIYEDIASNETTEYHILTPNDGELLKLKVFSVSFMLNYTDG